MARDGHQKRLLVWCTHLDPAENPLFAYETADIVFAAAEQALVDLDYDAGPTNDDGVGEKVLATNVSAEALPIHQCVIAHVELVAQRIAGHVVVHPQIHQLDYGGERQVTFRKESAMPDRQPSSARPAAPPRNAVVAISRQLPLGSPAPRAPTVAVKETNLQNKIQPRCQF